MRPIMSHRFIFSEAQLPEFRALAYALRDALVPYAQTHEYLRLPAKTAMLDIAAELLGYPHYQAFRRASKGHQTRSEPAVVLTADIFDAVIVQPPLRARSDQAATAGSGGAARPLRR